MQCHFYLFIYNLHNQLRATGIIDRPQVTTRLYSWKKWVSTNFSISKGIFEEIIWGNKNFWRQFDLVRYCDAWTDARSWLLARAESRRQGRLHHHQLVQHPSRDGVQLPQIRPQVMMMIILKSDDGLKASQSQEDRSSRSRLRYLLCDALWALCFCQGNFGFSEKLKILCNSVWPCGQAAQAWVMFYCYISEQREAHHSCQEEDQV